MKLEKPNYFSDDDLQMELLYGPDGEFSPTSLNFWTDIYPNILEAYLSNHEADKGYPDIFVDKSYYPLNIDGILRLATRVFMDVFPACFEIDFTKTRDNKIKSKEIKELQSQKGLVGALANVYNKVNINGKFFLGCLLYIVIQFNGQYVKLTDKLPKPLYEEFLKEIKTPFYMLADITGSKKIREEIDKIVFVPNPNAPKTIKKPKGYRIVHAEHCRSVVILDHIDFNRKSEDLFWDLVSSPGGFTTMESVFFINCKFSANYISNRDKMRSRVFFRNCVFEKELAPSSDLQQSWKIYNSVIKGSLDFRNSVFRHGLYILGCIFQENSFFRLDKSKFEQNDYIHSIYFKDTSFGGHFSMTQCNFRDCKIVMTNVAFHKPFFINETILSKTSIFEDIAFNMSRRLRMEMCKTVFGEFLVKAGYSVEAETLGLVSLGDKEESNKTHYTSAYRTGWFNPTQAANYLGKSKSWLAKKRMADKKKTTKSSLPFVGEKKKIYYPRRALEAYRIQDWNELKLYCQQYGIGAKEKPEPLEGTFEWIEKHERAKIKKLIKSSE